ncbi:hypothetical protein [Microterricola pindariensis]|uniref:MFS transporter n=1 Tax=Microterricola pindariensis TaxID=478010 RepID=A0ABX5ATF1_9MICO|nr:hypothetical protein [Microterricola pindariensis]PPL16515.1 hypothetical protein GY24_12610 [Microterricola pindariensis]
MNTASTLVRRAFYYWQFIAVFVLPAWLFVGWGLYGGSGWGFLGLLIMAPIVFIGLLVIALIIFARPPVRRVRAVSWKDVALLVVLHGAIIGLGFFGDSATWFLVLAIAAAIAGFWLTLWELVTEGARSMKDTMDAFEQAARMPEQPAPHLPGQGAQGPSAAPKPKPGDDPEVIVIHEVRD